MSIASEIARLQAAKVGIKDAINSRGGNITTQRFNDYADAIAGLPQGMQFVNGMKCSYWTLSAINSVDWSKVVGLTDMTYFFAYNTNLTNFTFNDIDTSFVTNMNNLFLRCTNLVSVDLSGLDTNKVASCGDLFFYCSKLTTVNLDGWDLSNATNFKFGENTTLLANVNGSFTGLGTKQSTIDLSKSPALTAVSLNNIISTLVPKSGVNTLVLHANAKNRLDSNIINFSNSKGWTIA